MPVFLYSPSKSCLFGPKSKLLFVVVVFVFVFVFVVLGFFCCCWFVVVVLFVRFWFV